MARNPQLESMFNALSMTMSMPEHAGDSNLVELYDGLRYMLQRENQGWEAIYGGGENSDALAIDLKLLKQWERELSELALGASWMKRGLMLRHGNIWQGGIRYGNIPAGGSQGVRDIQQYIDDKDNQREFFGHDARRRLESRLYYSGIAIYLANDKTKKIKAIPLHQITDQILDPEGRGIIWAYKREWSERDLRTGETTPRKMWYFTHAAIGHRVPYILEQGDGRTRDRTPVSQAERIFDLHANRIEGLAYGVPDSLAAASWHTVAKNAYLDGTTMTAALASFAFQVTSKTGKGASKASLELASPLPAGSTAVVGQNELQSIASAGKAYEFAKLTSLLAIIATSLDVSVVHLSAAPGDAGASYSAAESLDLPTRLAMGTRRDLHVDFNKQVLEWLGVKNPEVFYAPYESGVETYRAIQALILAAQAGVYTPQELRDMLDDLLANPNGKVPQGVKLWNNRATDEFESKLAKRTSASSDDNTSVASPTQGRGNGTGGQGGGSSNDVRDS